MHSSNLQLTQLKRKKNTHVLGEDIPNIDIWPEFRFPFKKWLFPSPHQRLCHIMKHCIRKLWVLNSMINPINTSMN